MKYLKLFEQNFDDPFGEESYGKEEKFKTGDFVVILNNDYGGKINVGKVGKIVHTDRRPVGDLRFVVQQKKKLWWYSGDGDIRKATEDEIKNYLER